MEVHCSFLSMYTIPAFKLFEGVHSYACSFLSPLVWLFLRSAGRELRVLCLLAHVAARRVQGFSGVRGDSLARSFDQERNDNLDVISATVHLHRSSHNIQSRHLGMGRRKLEWSRPPRPIVPTSIRVPLHLTAEVDPHE